MPEEDFSKGAIAEFERRGPAEVRMLFETHRYNTDVADLAMRWLLEKDRKAAEAKARAGAEADAARQREADEQKRIARSTLWAAWIAAVVAAIGVVFAAWPVVHGGGR